jgi:RNA polymerase sigma-70 factor (ECF subfamily)
MAASNSSEAKQVAASRLARVLRDSSLDRAAVGLFQEFCAEEDPDLFRQLFEICGPQLLPALRIKIRRYRAHVDCGELLVDTFAQVFRARRTFQDRGPGSFLSWFMTIAENLLLQHLREDERRLRREKRAARSIHDDNDPMAHLLREESEQLASISVGYLRRLILAAMQELTPRQEQVLLLRSVHQLSYAEISRRLGISVGAVTMRIKRARDRILEIVLNQLQSE